MSNNVCDRPIGIFDSGMGGLTVAAAIKRIMPNENLCYYGDTAHLPYGDKSKEMLVKYTQAIVDFFLEKNAKAIVVACNSATSNAWDEIVKRVDNRAKLYNVIDPVVNKVAFELHQHIGLIATKATVRSDFYRKKIRKLNKHIEVSSLATPLLVPLIEEGMAKSELTKLALAHYLNHKKLQHIDTLILGCTHYPIIHQAIYKFYGGRVKIVDSPLIVAHEIFQKLGKEELLNKEIKLQEDIFYVSDYTKHFEQMAWKFFDKKVNLQLLQF